MIKKFFLIFSLISLSFYTAGKERDQSSYDFNSSKKNKELLCTQLTHKNPLVWTYAIGIAFGLAGAISAKSSRCPHPLTQDVDTFKWAICAALFIGGSTTWIAAAKLEQVVCDYFGIENY